MYDLLIKGGRVIDPSQNIDDKLDIAISGGKISKVAKDIPAQESQQVIDARDKIVTPGLIDMHCHVCGSILNMCVEPDTAGVKQICHPFISYHSLLLPSPGLPRAQHHA